MCYAYSSELEELLKAYARPGLVDFVNFFLCELLYNAVLHGSL